MQPLPTAITDAGRALASGDPLRALGILGLEESAASLTLRGIAYAQLGDLELALESLERALVLRGDPLTYARARAALVEVLLGMGEAAKAAKAARAASEELAALGDIRNAAMQWLVLARAEVLLGRIHEARHLVEELVASNLPDDVRAVAWLAKAEIAIRAVSASGAREAITQARTWLRHAPNALLARTLVAIEEELSRPIARIVREKTVREADLEGVEEASRGEVLLVDACRLLAIGGRCIVPLARRPVLFAILLELAREWPVVVPRDELAKRVFDLRRVNDSHRARLRVELGRFRKLVASLGIDAVAGQGGYVLSTKREVVLLLPPSDDDDARIALLLGDGAAWTARAIAEHAGISRRTAQRALATLVERGAAVRTGQGKDVRYTRPGTPIASRMLLLGLLPKP